MLELFEQQYKDWTNEKGGVSHHRRPHVTIEIRVSSLTVIGLVFYICVKKSRLAIIDMKL